MNIDIDRTISLISGAFLERYGEKVDLILHYGSTVRGNAHECSDIDLCWVPADERDWQNLTVEVGGVFVDLFAIHWSRLAAIAEFDNPMGRILDYHRVIYARDEGSKARLAALVERHNVLQAPAARKDMLEKAMTLYMDAAYPLHLVERACRKGEILDAVAAGARFLDHISHCLIALNQQSIDTRKDLELLALPKLPKDFEAMRVAFAKSRSCGEMQGLALGIMESLRALLLAEQSEVCREAPDFARMADNGGCTEPANGLRHAAREAAKKDPVAFNRETCSILMETRFHVGQGVSGLWFHDFNSLSEHTAEIPGLDLAALQSAVVELDFEKAQIEYSKAEKDLKALFRAKGVNDYCFADIETLDRWIKEAWKE